MVNKGIDTVDPTYYTPGMAMGRRKNRARTPGLWIATNELPRTGGHPFYQRLNQVLETYAFDEFVEAQCAPFYADAVGRPNLTPGTYFRLLLIGYFEGIDSERGIAWRTADSLALRGFLGLGLDEVTPEHSTISRTRRLIDVETHWAVFTWNPPGAGDRHEYSKLAEQYAREQKAHIEWASTLAEHVGKLTNNYKALTNDLTELLQ